MSRLPRDASDVPSSPSRPKVRKPRKPSGPTAPGATGERVTSARNIHLGDVLKVERRYVVDGALTSVTDQGKFKGVQVLGSTEHLLLEDKKSSEVRLIPLHTISEIVIVDGATARKPDAFDPSFG